MPYRQRKKILYRPVAIIVKKHCTSHDLQILYLIYEVKIKTIQQEPESEFIIT